MPKPVTFPFELPKAPEPFFVEIDPLIASLMNNGSADEQKAIALIAPTLTQDGEVWGLNLPRRYGFNLAERTALVESQQADRETMKVSLKVFQEISKESGKSIKEIELAAQGTESGEGLDWFLPYADKMLDIEAAIKTTPVAMVECTLFIQRIIPKWATSNTMALHPKILQQLFDFRQEEQGEIEKTEPAPLGEMTEDSPSSENN